MKLYTYRTTRGMRPYWLIKELGIDCEIHEVDLMKQENLSPAYLAVNPMGKIPALVDGDLKLFESFAICNYLSEKYPDKKMIPEAGTRERALYDQWCLFAITELEGSLWTREKNIWFYPEEKRSAVTIETATEEFRRAADLLEKEIEGKTWILGERFSTADIIIGYALRWARGRKLLENHPNVGSYLGRMMERPAFPHELYPKK